MRLFPVLRENTGKFVDFSLKKTITQRVRGGNSMAYQWASLASKQGRFPSYQGTKIE
jgi:hypothetical protein